MHLDLTGRTALVTGAGRGIGETIALEFAAAGATVVATARTESEIESTVESIRDRGGAAHAISSDLSSVESIDALVDETVDAVGAPDVLVNNAGANLAASPLSQSSDDLDTMMAVNLRGTFVLSQRVANELLSADGETGGRIVNVSSIVADLGVPKMAAYGATKAGVQGLTRGLAAELSSHGITVNSVSPGMTRIDRIERLLEEKPEIYDVDRIPAGRLAEPEDVAAACVFLASDRAEYITGVDLPVDGGVTITAGLYR